MQPVRVAFDVEGGDRGADILIQGLMEAIARSQVPLTVHVCGDENVIAEIFEKLGVFPDTRVIVIEHCPHKLSQRDIPSRAWQTRANSSIVRCIALQQEGKVDVSLSAGDTRFLMASSIFILGRAEGVARPALAAFLPTAHKRPVLLLDVGANLNCRAEHLAVFGKIGQEYAGVYLGLPNPTVGLLNIGQEASKGTRAIREAGQMLAESCVGYIGYIEGGDVLSGKADVVVCDGFAGNILLKAFESLYGLAMSLMKENRDIITVIQDKIAVLNPENYGAVPLIGINGLVFKAHGASSAAVIANALQMAIQTAGRIIQTSPQTVQY
jgi:glycerol-3-phosphate acyltransferase PlsX